MDGSSVESAPSLRIKEPPRRLYKEYEPLAEIYDSHNQPLPQASAGIQDSNSAAIINALKSLQDKIRYLELERATAASKFNELAKETSQIEHHGGDLDDDGSLSDDDSDIPLVQSQPIDNGPNDKGFIYQRIESLDARFALQSQELELMKKRLRLAEAANIKHDLERPIQPAVKKPDGCRHLLASPDKETEDRISKLENVQAHLQDVHETSTSKIKNLEGKLLEKQWEKRQAQRHSPPMMFMNLENEPLINKKKKCPARRKKTKEPLILTKPIPGVHYHLKMKDVPFVVGKSTGPSHSVTANYQQVISLMKSHSPLLCGVAAANVGYTANRRTCSGAGRRKKQSDLPTSDELKGLLIALEEEYGHLTFEYQELTELLQQEDTPQNPHSNLEKELSQLITQMEKKMEQVQVVKKLLNDRKKQEKQQQQQQQQSDKSVTTCSSKKTNLSQKLLEDDSLHVLRKMKRLQTTLQRDDLHWT